MAEENEDDVTIEDPDGLLRRVPNWPNMFKLDKNMNAYRPTSLCLSWSHPLDFLRLRVR